MIKVLDNATINKIAAGEVIERPFSVIKELVENSIDAGSRKISVEIKEGGVSFIRVADDGCGILPEDVETAFKSHATSKITAISDLSGINTLGFRGEALASIAAVSQLEVTSRAKDAETAVCMEVYGGQIMSKRETAANHGTIMVVRNLFYNTPARKKFLKSNSAETGFISDFINKIALSRPDISIRYMVNNVNTLYSSGNGDLKTAIFSVYGKDYAEKLIPVDYNYRDIIVTGFVTKPEMARSNRAYEDLFVNGRYVKDKIVARAAENAYKTRLPIGKFPSYVLNMEISGSKIDVNAHPQKLEIRFRDEELAYNSVYNAVTSALQSAVLTFDGGWGEPKKEKDRVKESEYDNKVSAQSCRVGETTLLEKPVSAGLSDIKIEAVNKPVKNNYGTRIVLDKPAVSLNYEEYDPEKAIFAKMRSEEYEQPTVIEKSRLLKDYRIIGRAFSTYWIVEELEKIYIIDQHAAHERILFERFSNYTGEITSQQLLMPEKLHLSQKEASLLEDNIGHIQKLGFGIEIKDGYYLCSVPVMHGVTFNKAMLMDMLDILEDTGRLELDMKEALASAACKAAVKAKDRLAEEEARGIIKLLLELENPFTCPHGRPTIIEMSKYELEKRFKRV